MERTSETDLAMLLGRRLRQARLAAGFTSQEMLAAAIGFDRSVIAKAETGYRPPTPEVMTSWAEECKLPDPDLYADLARLARTSDAPIPRWFESWLEAEEACTLLRYWQPLIITPIFQTASYARALLLPARADTSADAISLLVEAKLGRAVILDRSDPPDVIALIDELVLHRLIGTPETMQEQLTHVAELAERPYVCVQVVPTSAGATAGLSGAVNLASGDAPLAGVLHTDAVPEGHTSESSSQVRRAAVVFERIRGYAISRIESHDLLLKVANEWVH